MLQSACEHSHNYCYESQQVKFIMFTTLVCTTNQHIIQIADGGADGGNVINIADFLIAWEPDKCESSCCVCIWIPVEFLFGLAHGRPITTVYLMRDGFDTVTQDYNLPRFGLIFFFFKKNRGLNTLKQAENNIYIQL